jgi:hypothetical protein
MTGPSPRLDRVSPRWGSPLNENDYANLGASWITPDLAEQAMLRRVDTLEGREVIGQKGNRNCAGMLIPYYRPGDPEPFNYRLRRDNPEFEVDRDGRTKPKRKYLGPPTGSNRLYIPPGVTPEQLSDGTIPIALVEGEKKALALLRLANHGAETLRFVPIAIAGVWNWRGVVGKTGGPNGERLDVRGPIPDLGWVQWAGRIVFIVFDTNVHTNDSVKWARQGICRELATRGADVKLVNLPEDCGVNGIDDLLAKWGPEQVLELFTTAASGARLHIVLPAQFQSRPDGLFRVMSRSDQLSQTRLTNFQAKIITNVQLDDGVETKREFEIEAQILGRQTRFTIPAPEFTNMNWVIEQLGATAITFPNQREYARTAIQALSLTVTEKRLYTHTGWREVDGRRLYLHAGGAIGADGDVSDINVKFAGALDKFALRLPASPSALADAVTASLRILELGSQTITFPLLAAIFRAVFGAADFALHIVGETGTFKSELAALCQQFFGSAMNRVNLPGTWSSTANSLEVLAFHAKDALFVIDDFAPPGGGNELARYHAAAERVFRAAGNHAGRGRLDSSAKLREPKPPRALILSTGEDIPRGHSVRARLLILELAKGNIDAANLGKCQADARDGLYCTCLAGFIRWVAGRYDETRAAFARKLGQYRAKALLSAAHARTPEIIASLQAAFELFLEFAVAAGAIDATLGGALGDQCWEALREAAATQAKHQGETEPAGRFIAIIQSLFTSGGAHLAGHDGGVPGEAPESCGWRRTPGTWTFAGHRIGWIDGDAIYIDPTAAYRAVQMAGRDIGEPLVVSEQTLRKRLYEKGLLASIDKARQTLTIRRSINGSSKNVLHFRRTTILPDTPDTEEQAG